MVRAGPVHEPSRARMAFPATFEDVCLGGGMAHLRARAAQAVGLPTGPARALTPVVGPPVGPGTLGPGAACWVPVLSIRGDAGSGAGRDSSTSGRGGRRGAGRAVGAAGGRAERHGGPGLVLRPGDRKAGP